MQAPHQMRLHGGSQEADLIIERSDRHIIAIEVSPGIAGGCLPALASRRRQGEPG